MTDWTVCTRKAIFLFGSRLNGPVLMSKAWAPASTQPPHQTADGFRVKTFKGFGNGRLHDIDIVGNDLHFKNSLWLFDVLLCDA